MPAVGIILGTTVGTAVVVWIYARVHHVIDAINDVVARLG